MPDLTTVGLSCFGNRRTARLVNECQGGKQYAFDCAF